MCKSSVLTVADERCCFMGASCCRPRRRRLEAFTTAARNYLTDSSMYFSNGRAIGMVVVRQSVRPSVCNGCTLANGWVVGENFVHE